LDRAIKSLHNTYGEFERFRPFIMATMLETLLRVDSNSTMTETVVQDLLASRQRDGEYLLWPEKSEPSLTAPSPSVVHTARALRSLSLLQEALPSSTYAEAISQAVDWLLTYDDFQPASEILDRSINHRTEPLYIRHFTAAWVLKALVATGVPTSHQSVQLALGQVWDNLNLESHLWRWPNGDLPIWMTFDAIEALHVTALASISRPPITTELIGVS
jgi:hypothetical protein